MVPSSPAGIRNQAVKQQGWKEASRATWEDQEPLCEEGLGQLA